MSPGSPSPASRPFRNTEGLSKGTEPSMGLQCVIAAGMETRPASAARAWGYCPMAGALWTDLREAVRGPPPSVRQRLPADLPGRQGTVTAQARPHSEPSQRAPGASAPATRPRSQEQDKGQTSLTGTWALLSSATRDRLFSLEGKPRARVISTQQAEAGEEGPVRWHLSSSPPVGCWLRT